MDICSVHKCITIMLSVLKQKLTSCAYQRYRARPILHPVPTSKQALLAGLSAVNCLHFSLMNY